MKKKSLLILLVLLVMFFTTGINQSQAAFVDLGTDPSGWLNDGYFERYDVNPAGRGAYGTFLATQGDAGNAAGVNRGYNSDFRPVEFNETNAAPHNHSLLLSDVGQVQIGVDWYYEFALDADQTASTPNIQLDMLQIFQTNSANAHVYGTGQLSPTNAVWDLDVGPDDDSYVIVNYNTSSGGSGWADMIFNVPTSLFDTNVDHVVLYTQFSLDNDGPQEWRHREATSVPEPATMLLFGSGILGLGLFGRRRVKI